MQKLLVYKSKSGFVTELVINDFMKERRCYLGNIPKIATWFDNPELWLWLLEHNIFNNCDSIEELDEDMFLMLIVRVTKTFSVISSNRFISETEFILSLIDKLELDIGVDKASDYMRLNTLERLCHNRGFNLLDFFIALENDSSFEPVSSLIFTSACLYHRALEILLGARDLSYTKTAFLCGISRENFISDKSDSLRGKRKTIEIRTLFKYINVLSLSFSVFFALCDFIYRTDTRYK